jgi:hypothetical protein
MSSEEYVRITAEPPWTTGNALAIIERAKEEARRIDIQRILFDVRRWERPATEMVRYDTGVHLAKLLASPYRVAALGQKEHVNYFAEDVAVNRGASFRVFTDEMSALEWLLA